MKTIFVFLFTISLLYASSYKKEELLEGKKIYNLTCVSCHGIKGDSMTNMKLSVKPRILTNSILNQSQLKKIISDGAHTYGAYSDIMASFKYLLNDDQLDSISKYVHSEFVQPRQAKIDALYDSKVITKEPTLKRGKKIFNRNCALCHGKKGNGKSEYVEISIKNNNFIYPYDLRKILLTKKQIFLFAKFGGELWGAHGTIMPSWKKKYNDSDLMSVSKYVSEIIQQTK